MKILEGQYGIPKIEILDPVDLLVSTILSQNTSDLNSGRAFSLLKRAYPDYLLLLGASEEEIADLIRPGGLGEMKAKRIKGILTRLMMDEGKITLDFLRDMPLEEARKYLQSIPGVGPKTASVVLLFGFGKATMPVDTHVYRVSRRIGLVPEKASVEEAQRILEKVTPPEKYFSLHMNLISHGRRVCKARSPLCVACALRGICDYYRARSGQKG
jgi:endonuclease-3